MTAKTMAEVLAEHWSVSTHADTDNEPPIDKCDGCGKVLHTWGDQIPEIHPLAAHQAAVLSAAGFGLVADAKAEALEEAADELAKLQYVRPDQPGREEYERLLAIRRGETDLWLYTRARALKDPS